MTKLKLNRKKVKDQLKLLKKNQEWLAKELGISKQLLSYHLRVGTIRGAEFIAPVFGLDPKDLLI